MRRKTSFINIGNTVRYVETFFNDIKTNINKTDILKSYAPQLKYFEGKAKDFRKKYD